MTVDKEALNLHIRAIGQRVMGLMQTPCVNVMSTAALFVGRPSDAELLAMLIREMNAEWDRRARLDASASGAGPGPRETA